MAVDLTKAIENPVIEPVKLDRRIQKAMKDGMNMMPKAKSFITRLHQDLNTGMNMMSKAMRFIPRTQTAMKIGSNMTPKAI